MKKIIFLFILFGAFSLATSSGDNIGGDILKEFQNTTANWYGTFQNVAKVIFASLATIELVIVFGFLAMEGNIDFGPIFATLVKNILLFGLFIAFIDNKDWFTSIVSGFEQLADKANGTPVALSDIFNLSLDVFRATMTETDKLPIMDIAERLELIITGIIAALAILFLGIELLLTAAKFLIMLNAGVLFFAFGAFSYTRQWAYNTANNFIKFGVEILFIKLIISLAFTVIPKSAAEVVSSDTSAFSTIMIALTFLSLARMVHPLAESIFTGGMISNNSGGFVSGALKSIATPAAAAAGAYMGVQGASAAVKAATESGSNVGLANKMAAGLGGATSGAIKGTLSQFGMANMRNVGENIGSFFAQPPGFGKTNTGSSSGIGSGSTSSREVPLGTDSGFGGVDGTIGNAMTEPKPNGNNFKE